MSKAILAVSFGTAYEETRKKTIEAIEAELAAAFPDRKLYTAWTSGMILRKLKKLGQETRDTLEEALARMEGDGVTDLLVQPTFLQAGYEMRLVRETLEKWAGRFGRLKLGAVLVENPADLDILARALEAHFSGLGGDEALVLMGHGSEGAPYPTRLAAYSGKTVLNFGVGAVEASYGAKTVGSALARKPGYVCILFGANDCIHGTSAETSLASLRRIVQACKANKTRPLVATPTPMRAPHFGQSARILRLTAGIRAIAKEEGVPCIDLNAAFGDGEGLLAPDGLHMTDAGNDLIARKFNSRL